MVIKEQIMATSEEFTYEVTVRFTQEVYDQLCILKYLANWSDDHDTRTRSIPDWIRFIVEHDVRDWIQEYDIVRKLG